MVNKIRLFGAFLLLFCGCLKEGNNLNSDRIIDKNYPTTYYTLSSNTLNVFKKEYLNDKDSCFQTSLNAYGFCASSDSYNFNCDPPCLNLTREQAVDMVKKFLQVNKKFTGVTDPSAIDITSCRAFAKGHSCIKDSVFWNITIGNQLFNGIEIENTGIFFRLNADGIQEVTGNWFPIVYLPKNDVYSYDLAKKQLLGKEFDFMCWTNLHVVINQDTKWTEPAVKKILYPLYTGDTIEIHLVWVLQTGTFYFYVDTTTGKIIASGMTVIC